MGHKSRRAWQHSLLFTVISTAEREALCVWRSPAVRVREAAVGVYNRNGSLGGQKKMSDRVGFGTPQNVGFHTPEAKKDLHCWTQYPLSVGQELSIGPYDKGFFFTVV